MTLETMRALLEICCYNPESVFIAAGNGADRVELCAGRYEGGTTPSIGAVKESLKAGIPVFPIIRPRGGDFLYSEKEYSEMKTDLLQFLDAGVQGVVYGILKKDGSFDAERMQEMAELSGSADKTCHRAFDMCKDPAEAAQLLLQCGIRRILTSGQKKSAPEGKSLLQHLVKESGEKIIFMAGGGVRAANIRELWSAGIREFHSSAITVIASEMTFRNSEAAMGNTDEYLHHVTDGKQVAEMKKLLESLQ